MMRKLEAVTPRVETGPTRFGEDWPGLFIRGDEALGYAMQLDQIIDGIIDDRWTVKHALQNHRLASCRMKS